MNTKLFVLALVVLLGLVAGALAAPNAAQAFASFKTAHSKQYSDPSEEALRFEVFQRNMLLADELNKKLNSNAFGVNGPFADLTTEEFAAYLMKPEVVKSALESATPPTVTYFATSGTVFPPPGGVGEWDWSTNLPGSVTPVRNQGSCGSCWAFAASEVLESRWVISGKNQRILAPQQLVDCTYLWDGCYGGLPSTAWQYLMLTNGQSPEAKYNYTGVYSGLCKYRPKTGLVKPVRVDGIASSESAIYNYLHSNGPLAILVDATNFHLYNGNNAVFPASQCTGDVNHAVVITGHNTINNVDVWRVKNSWGTAWGNAGYIYLPMNVNACKLADYPQGASI